MYRKNGEWENIDTNENNLGKINVKKNLKKQMKNQV